MVTWVTINLETENFNFDVDVEVDVTHHEAITEDVGVEMDMVVEPAHKTVEVISVEMEGHPMPPPFVKLIERTIEDYELEL